jgi:hypothetical protein
MSIFVMTRNIPIDASKITDWASFHDYFAPIFGFPEFYGRNMDAWIDCMSYLNAPEEGMTSVHVVVGDVLVLNILGASDFKKRCPEIYDALIECSAFVNYRRIETGEQAVLALAFHC